MGLTHISCATAPKGASLCSCLVPKAAVLWPSPAVAPAVPPSPAHRLLTSGTFCGMLPLAIVISTWKEIYPYYRTVVDQQLRQTSLNERSVHSPRGKKILGTTFMQLCSIHWGCSVALRQHEEVKEKETQEWVRNEHQEWVDEDSEDKSRDKLNIVKGRHKLERVGRKKKKQRQKPMTTMLLSKKPLRLLNLQIWGLFLLFIICSPKSLLFICLVIISTSSLCFINEKVTNLFAMTHKLVQPIYSA